MGKLGNLEKRIDSPSKRDDTRTMFIAGSIQSQESLEEMLETSRRVSKRIHTDKRFARKFMRMLDEAAGRIPPPSPRSAKATRGTATQKTAARA